MNTQTDEGATAGQKNRRILRVMAYPAFKNRRINPYNWLLSQALISQGVEVHEFDRTGIWGRDDIWHVHWPEGVARLNGNSWPVAALRAAMLLLLLRVGRLRGKRIVWTVHNLESHERKFPWLEARFWSAYSRVVDGFIVLNNDGLRAVRGRFAALRRVPGFVIPHGHYRPIYSKVLVRSEARRILNITPDVRVAGYVGQIRPYKNVPALITEFRRLASPDVLLLVGGSPLNSGLAREVYEAAEDDRRVRLDLRFLSEREVQQFVSASDLLVLPFQEILNSGSSILALSLNRPILVPNTTAFAELREVVGPEWVYTYEPPLTSSIVEDALARAVTAERPETAPLETLEWEGIGHATVAAYSTILNRTAALPDVTESKYGRSGVTAR